MLWQESEDVCRLCMDMRDGHPCHQWSYVLMRQAEEHVLQ